MNKVNSREAEYFLSPLRMATAVTHCQRKHTLPNKEYKENFLVAAPELKRAP
jgi:hypothetical protein